MIAYEQLLDDDLRWALDEADRYFAGQSAVHLTLQALANCLSASGIDYAVIGALAMFFHGFRRFTNNVNLLVTPSGLEQLDQRLLGRGYHRPSDWRRGIRDDTTGVEVRISTAGTPLETGAYPSFVFPDPGSAVVDCGGVKVIDLPTLLELKIALGSRPARLGHLADAQALIQELDLSCEYRSKLKPIFREEYAKLWQFAQIAKADDY